MSNHNYQPKVFANNLRQALLNTFPRDSASLPMGYMNGEGQAFVVTTADGTRYFVAITEAPE